MVLFCCKNHNNNKKLKIFFTIIFSQKSQKPQNKNSKYQNHKFSQNVKKQNFGNLLSKILHFFDNFFIAKSIFKNASKNANFAFLPSFLRKDKNTKYCVF